MKSEHYERLFLLNRCLQQAAEILGHFKQEGLIHSAYADDRQQALNGLRADLSCILAGMLHRKEMEESIVLAGVEAAKRCSSD